MPTFRELAMKLIEEAIADLQSRGEICDGHGVLAGAMVDASTIAVQDWLREFLAGPCVQVSKELRCEYVNLIREAGRVTP